MVPRRSAFAPPKFLTQSMAIERYVARLLDLMGEDEVEAAQIQQVAETVRLGAEDIRTTSCRDRTTR